MWGQLPFTLQDILEMLRTTLCSQVYRARSVIESDSWQPKCSSVFNQNAIALCRDLRPPPFVHH